MAKKKLKIVYKDIGSLTRNPKNAKKHPQSQLDGLKKIILLVGQATPLVVDSKGVIRKGNGTFMALEQLVAEGHKQFAAVACLVTDLKGSDLTAWEIADNKLPQDGEWDHEALCDLLQELEDDENFEDITATGFSLQGVDECFRFLEEGMAAAEGMPQPHTMPQSPAGTGAKRGGGAPRDPNSGAPAVDPTVDPDLSSPAPVPPGAVQNITLLFEKEEFEVVNERLKRVRVDSGLADNSSAVAWLLEQYCKQPPETK